MFLDLIKTGFNKIRGIREGIGAFLGGARRVSGIVRRGLHTGVDFLNNLRNVPILGTAINTILDNPITQTIINGADVIDDLLNGDLADIEQRVDQALDAFGIPVSHIGRPHDPSPLPNFRGVGPDIAALQGRIGGSVPAGSSETAFVPVGGSTSAISNLARN